MPNYERDPLAKTNDEGDNFEHHAGNKVDYSLRRASTASFNIKEHSEKGQVKFSVYKDKLPTYVKNGYMDLKMKMHCGREAENLDLNDDQSHDYSSLYI
ncbi:hypothetical protein V1523DRAFT_429952, partial [Lipomyces doorenjongii]